MTERLAIQSGHNSYDPVRDYMEEAVQSPANQDPGVAERCPEVLRHASNLTCRLAGTHTLFNDSSPNFLRIKTPTVNYLITDDKKGLKGSVWLESLYESPDPDEITIDFQATQVALMTGSPGAPEKCLFVLTHDTIERNAFGSGRPAGHVELNFMVGVVRDIHDKAFPKSKKLQEEKRLDQEADRLRRTRQATSK